VSAHHGVVASALAAPLIDGPRQALKVVHRSRYAWQLADGAGRVVLSVMIPAAMRLPNGAVVPSLPRGSPPISVGDGTLGWDGLSLRVARWFRPAHPALPSLLSRVDDAAARSLVRHWSDGLGRGDGLTPYADDVVCGGLVALHAARHPASAELGRAVAAADLEMQTTALSAALLRLAADGYCIDPLAAFLAALAADDGSAAAGMRRRAALAALLLVGHSSGRGLAEGAFRVLGLSDSQLAAA
jgi:hypothetical protein